MLIVRVPEAGETAKQEDVPDGIQVGDEIPPEARSFTDIPVPVLRGNSPDDTAGVAGGEYSSFRRRRFLSSECPSLSG